MLRTEMQNHLGEMETINIIALQLLLQLADHKYNVCNLHIFNQLGLQEGCIDSRV